MTDLADARVELARLQRRELELIKELLDVRKAVATQKVVIDELIKASVVPYIDRLPNELLVRIFLIGHQWEWRDWREWRECLRLTRRPWERDCLASVSRRWRAVIMRIPSIWSEVRLDCYHERPTLSKLHLDLERSRQAPLTVFVGCDSPELGVVLSHANRIHTLWISGYTETMLSKISGIRLPSLQYLFLEGGCSVDLLIMIRSCSPVLKHLGLNGLAVSSPSHWTLSRILPAESLEELSLAGYNNDWEFEFQKDYLHFPLLHRLTLDINCPKSFLEAIVTPKLASFCFTGEHFNESTYGAFSGTASKFNNVSHLSFATSPCIRTTVNKKALDMSKTLCRIFRGIRYATIHVDYVSTLFSPLNCWKSSRCLIDCCWTFLESLEIRDFTLSSIESLGCLMAWLTWRENSGQPKLHFKLTYKPNANDLVTLNNSHTLYRTLQECCASVVLDGVPVSF